jgi:hypothetical protein
MKVMVRLTVTITLQAKLSLYWLAVLTYLLSK